MRILITHISMPYKQCITDGSTIRVTASYPYYDDGTITDPRSVLLGAETYPISYKADWFNDLPATIPENELEVVRDNILAHMRGWDTWDEDDGDVIIPDEDFAEVDEDDEDDEEEEPQDNDHVLKYKE